MSVKNRLLKASHYLGRNWWLAFGTSFYRVAVTGSYHEKNTDQRLSNGPSHLIVFLENFVKVVYVVFMGDLPPLVGEKGHFRHFLFFLSLTIFEETMDFK